VLSAIAQLPISLTCYGPLTHSHPASHLFLAENFSQRFLQRFFQLQIPNQPMQVIGMHSQIRAASHNSRSAPRHRESSCFLQFFQRRVIFRLSHLRRRSPPSSDSGRSSGRSCRGSQAPTPVRWHFQFPDIARPIVIHQAGTKLREKSDAAFTLQCLACFCTKWPRRIGNISRRSRSVGIVTSTRQR